MVCLWVLLDVSHMLHELDLTKAQLQSRYSQEQLQLLQKQNMELRAAIYHSTETHVLLCEIRHRIIHHDHKAQRSFSDLTLQQVVEADKFNNPLVQECVARCKSSPTMQSPSNKLKVLHPLEKT